MERSKKEFEQVSDATIDDDDGIDAVCDGTQNVKQYRYRYFFPVPNIFATHTGTFFGTKFFRYWFRDFFRYQILPIPILRLFPEQKFSDNVSDTTGKN